jgi:protein phosphatase
MLLVDVYWIAPFTALILLLGWLVLRSRGAAQAEAKPAELEQKRSTPARDVKSEAKKAAAPTPTPTPTPRSSSPSIPDTGSFAIPNLRYDDDDTVDEPTRVSSQLQTTAPPSVPKTFVVDDEAGIDEPTQNKPLILVAASGQSDNGRARKRNEDAVLMREDHGLFVVADGMGGYSGGDVASELAIRTIEEAFDKHHFDGAPEAAIPARASELSRAIQMANAAVYRKATGNRKLEGMGTTVCAARFAVKKQRLYIGHVGDSRVYCLRDGALRQITSDHTMAEFGLRGTGSSHLSRAVGVSQTVPVDVVIGKPRAGDVYLLCSDGLTKMVEDTEIERVLRDSSPPAAVERLIDAANDRGGKDNISVIVVSIEEPQAASA